jgi:transmembrane sensor
MDQTPSNTFDDLPWQLIVSSLQGELSPEEERVFSDWLNASPANKEKYEQIKKVWREDLADYSLYENADENQAWTALQKKKDSRVLSMKKWTIAAVIFLLVGAPAIWYFASRNDQTIYQTAAAEKRTLPLPDGSTIILQPGSALQIAKNQSQSRNIILISGAASFEVVHNKDLPFIVDMDFARITDIGTRFTITKTTDSINIQVAEGIIAFDNKTTGETKELSAGDALTLYTSKERKGQTHSSLRFDAAPLSEIIESLQKHFKKIIRLEDPASENKKLTLHLDGESLQDIMQIIATSLDLEISNNETEYILKKNSK